MCTPVSRAPIMNQWKAYFVSASVWEAFLLYYFTKLWSWLVVFVPIPWRLVQSGCRCRALTYTNTLIHWDTHVHTHSLSVAVGSMQKSHLIMFWLTSILFVLAHNEVCLVNRNGRSARGKESTKRACSTQLNICLLKAIWRLHAVYASYMSVCVRKFGMLIWDLV